MSAAPDRLPDAAPPEWLQEWESYPASGLDIRYPSDVSRDDAVYFGELARSVRARVDPFLPHPIYGTPTIALFATRRDFVAETRIAEDQTPAAARSQPPIIYVNLEVMRAMSTHEQEKTLAHELAHLFLGRFAEAPLPLWLEEGLAMAIEGEDADHLALAWARVSGGLPPLRDLTHRFPPSGESRRLAYSMSRAVVGHILAEQYPETGLQAFLYDLVEPGRGERIIYEYHESVLLDGLDRSWRQTLTLRAAMLIILTNETMMWVLLAGLAVVCYIVIKVRRRRRFAEMDATERMRAAMAVGEYTDNSRVSASSIFPSGAGVRRRGAVVPLDPVDDPTALYDEIAFEEGYLDDDPDDAPYGHPDDRPPYNPPSRPPYS